MTRHGKNATASSVYSYSERRKDASQSGYGTLHERLSADSIKPFDCCSLSLQPCREPLISPDGFIFDKESILNYILDQKKAYKRKLKIWEEQTRIDQEKESAVPETPSASERTVKRYNAGGDDDGPTSSKKKATTETSVSNMAGDKARKWNNFWVPELIPTAEPTKIEKPSDKIMCPITEKPLKYKELMQVKFTPIDNDHNGDHAKLVGKKYRYMCPITRDVLTNTSRCAYLKTSQAVVSMNCIEMILKDMIDPISGKQMQESDIIELQRGGTGYAATNEVKAKLVRPQLELQ
ncbi:zinc-finger of nitric oxide synthase-interacting protein domain-containing protein [Ditylenchus destructor]|uniref:Nitric oxide synthase-interacting protein homolog n=1 Tax=Ditylenchus destructor TaxID=166010 RepID=A0AAD4R563_9BILA|nr:zinc-finger of nitric oxide synthase-interacting protein domain-containing protein [Ditylenchus destructor]